MSSRAGKLRRSIRRVELDADAWATLDAWADKALMTRSELLERIVGVWTARPSLASLGVRARKVDQAAGDRERILRRWLDIRHATKKANGSINAALAAFIDTMAGEGVKLCRATLYNWDAAYRRRGRVGLIDRRQVIQLDGISGRGSVPARVGPSAPRVVRREMERRTGAGKGAVKRGAASTPNRSGFNRPSKAV